LVDSALGFGSSMWGAGPELRSSTCGTSSASGLSVSMCQDACSANPGALNRFPWLWRGPKSFLFADCCCDVILCECVLSLVTEPQRALREFLRVLRADGVLILSDIYDRQPDCGGSREPVMYCGCSSMLQTRTFIEKLLGDSGFELLVWEDHTRYLKELAAQLILSSEPHTEIHEYRTILNSWCGSLPGSRLFSPGYFLLVARNSKKGERFNG